MITRLMIFAATSVLATSVAATAAPLRSLAPIDRGNVQPNQSITITVRLALPHAALFAKTVDALYAPGSPTFHRWMSDEELARFAPPASEVATVRAELERNGLRVLSISKNAYSIRARGTVAQVGRAFHTSIHAFEANGAAYRSSVGAVRLGGAAGAYVASVAGIESHTVRPMLAHAIDVRTKRAYPPVALSKVVASGGLSSVITDTILTPAETVKFVTPGATLPTATFTAAQYDVNPNLFPDYTPKQLESAYGLDQAYAKGLDGTGQTIVLLEAYGYPTIAKDANALFKLSGLSPLTPANFSVVYPDGKPVNPQIGNLTGWDVEIALDVQWAHSIAPGAKILVVASNGQDSEDFQSAMQYIIDNRVGYTVSDSWEEDTDLISGPAEQESFEGVLVGAAARGISFQFSTGDGGDGGVGSPVGAAGVPSVAPHATAVGGTSIFNNLSRPGTQPAGWGDTFDYIDSDGPIDPPTELSFFFGGGGGGESVFWSKPSWQASLPGHGRQTPDVSALSDPYTGVPIVVTDPTSGLQDLFYGYGGTSLGSPIFTAFWALAQQKAGHPLGQASPTIAGLHGGLIDVKPLSKPGNLTGSVTDKAGTTTYDAQQVFAPINPSGQHVYAPLWNQPQYSDALAFGTALDSSLTVTVGWDNVTGYGTPDGLSFIYAAAAYH